MPLNFTVYADFECNKKAKTGTKTNTKVLC